MGHVCLCLCSPKGIIEIFFQFLHMQVISPKRRNFTPDTPKGQSFARMFDGLHPSQKVCSWKGMDRTWLDYWELTFLWLCLLNAWCRVLPYFYKRWISVPMHGQGKFDMCNHLRYLMHNYIHTWNPNDPCFDWKRPFFGVVIFKNRGHLGSVKWHEYNLFSFGFQSPLSVLT